MVSAWWLIVLVAAVPLTSSTQGAHIFNATLAEEGERRAEGAAKCPNRSQPTWQRMGAASQFAPAAQFPRTHAP